jgi:hypothetical protein
MSVNRLIERDLSARLGTTRSRGHDQNSINGSHQGLRSKTAPTDPMRASGEQQTELSCRSSALEDL